MKHKTSIVIILITLLMIFMIFLISCENEQQKMNEEEEKTPNEIILTTADDINITGAYNEIIGAQKAVLLLHMLGKDKSDYDGLTTYMLQSGYTVLAIDFRGHGNSDLDYTTFTEDDWQKLVLDVQAGADFLEKKGYMRDIAVIGASIGANAGFKQAVQDERIQALVLLSAGEEYKGVNIIDLAEFYDSPVLFVASMDDKDAAVAATRLYNAVGTEYKEIKLYKTGGHGTDLLETQEGLSAMIVTWLQNYYG